MSNSLHRSFLVHLVCLFYLVEPTNKINETNQIDQMNQTGQTDLVALFRPQARKSSFQQTVYRSHFAEWLVPFCQVRRLTHRSYNSVVQAGVITR